LALAVGRPFLNMEAKVRFQANLCGIYGSYGEYSGIETSLSMSTQILPCLCHSLP
jgi:hypothetical protein